MLTTTLQGSIFTSTTGTKENSSFNNWGDRARFPLKFRPKVLITASIVVADTNKNVAKAYGSVFIGVLFLFQVNLFLFLFRGITRLFFPYLPPVPRAGVRGILLPRLRPDGLVWGY